MDLAKNLLAPLQLSPVRLEVDRHEATAANRNSSEEIWQSVLVICEENQDGSLTTTIIACHPGWDQNLQIASIRSPMLQGEGPVPALEFDLKQAHV